MIEEAIEERVFESIIEWDDSIIEALMEGEGSLSPFDKLGSSNDAFIVH